MAALGLAATLLALTVSGWLVWRPATRATLDVLPSGVAGALAGALTLAAAATAVALAAFLVHEHRHASNADRMVFGRALQRTRERRPEQRSRLAGVVEAAMDAIITVDETQSVVFYNRAAESMFGVPAEQAIGSAIDRFLPARFRAAHRQHIVHFGETGSTTRRMGRHTVLYGLHADGREFPIEASISQIEVEGHRLYTVIVRDVSERVRHEQEIERHRRELAELARAANDALEAERRRVARELHDELGQMLTAIRMDVAAIKASDPAALEQRCAEVEALLDRTIAGVRRLSADLRPLVLDDLGLAAAIEWLAASFAQRTGIEVKAVTEGVDNVPEPQASAAFRIVQESLTNVGRHAQARHVHIRVARDGAALRLEVCDDGRGLAQADLHKPEALGLRGMRERARLLGGDANATRANGGTVVSATIPLIAQGGARP